MKPTILLNSIQCSLKTNNCCNKFDHISDVLQAIIIVAYSKYTLFKGICFRANITHGMYTNKMKKGSQ